jgi:hypothetical protein
MHLTTLMHEYVHGLCVGSALKRRGTGANGLTRGPKKLPKTASSSSSSPFPSFSSPSSQHQQEHAPGRTICHEHTNTRFVFHFCPALVKRRP